MQVNGQCHCGAVHVSAQVDPARVFVCHCTDCQVMTGSAFRVVVPVLAESLVVQGETTQYAKTADSGAVRWQCFCPACGTPLFARAECAGGVTTLRVGVLDQRARLVPAVQLWQRSALPWVHALADTPSCQRQELLG